MTGASITQAEYWNGPAAQRWVRHNATLDDSLEFYGSKVMDELDIRPGQRVMDIGCGCGSTTFSLANRLSPNGTVLGLDISQTMLALANQKKTAQPTAERITFIEADASAYSFDREFDRLFSRFGVMFFSDPVAAFANLRTALKPDGKLGFVCWAPTKENPWTTVVVDALRSMLTIEPSDPHAPGPFAFADTARVTDILSRSGFTNIATKPLESRMRMGPAGLSEAAEFAVEIGPAARLLADKDASVRAEAVKLIYEALRPYATDEGVFLASKCWIVTANAG